MNWRIRKKIAKRYLEGGNVQRYILGVDEYPDGTGDFRAEAVFPQRIRLAIMKEAYRRGWNGYWGDSPFLIYAGDFLGYANILNTRLKED